MAPHTDRPRPRAASILGASRRLLVALVAVCALGGVAMSARASADTGLAFLPGTSGFSVSVTNADGTPDTQAGSHPFAVTTSFAMNLPNDNGGVFDGSDALKDVIVHLPAGLVGNAASLPQCTGAELTTGNCPGSAQVGVISLTFFGPRGPINQVEPVYNMIPNPGHPASFAFAILGVTTYLDVAVRTGGDYGLDFDVENITQTLAFQSMSVTFWGVPGDTAHDAQRVCAGGVTPCSDTSPEVPFITMPTACSSAMTFGISADGWSSTGDWITDSATNSDGSGDPLGVTGCANLPFAPALSVQATSSRADSPTGLDVDLSVPQPQTIGGLAEANLQNATVMLPAGVTIDPSAAFGLTGCAPAQIGMSSATAPACPDASKIGTAQIQTPLLPDPLQGGIYVAQQNANPFGSLLAVYVTAYADGVWIKLAGDVTADPATGQLTASFQDNPQLPFSDLQLDFFGGAQGILATPQQCGSATASASLSPWSGGAATATTSTLQFTSGCEMGFAPSVSIGTENAQAGAFSPLVLTMTRTDQQPNFSGLSLTLPDGLLAKLAGVSECSDAQLAAAATDSAAAQLAAPSCPAGSQVGTVSVQAGTGPSPFSLSGSVYLTGPYRGAPYGLALVVPALAGPYDLGTVVVRQQLEVNPDTAQVTDVSDPFPTILQGIPLDLRSVVVDLDRPGFTVNPTSCDATSVLGTVSAVDGSMSPIDTRFQVGGCAALRFTPRLRLRASGRGETRTGSHPRIEANLSVPTGQAHLASATVTLPLSLALDPNNSNHLCPYAVAAAVRGGAVGCPKSSIVGEARAYTPLLSQPIRGPVYLVQGIRFHDGQRIHTLPGLLVPLRGQLAIDLRAKTSVNGAGALVTRFASIPDAAVRRFSLTLTGGHRGLLVITGVGDGRSQSICAAAQTGAVTFGAHSGASHAQSVRLATPACARAGTTQHPQR